MCGIFGLISKNNVNLSHLHSLAGHARQRGRDSSGLMYSDGDAYQVKRADYDINQLLKKHKNLKTTVVMGHSRLITNGLADNQPVVRDGIGVLHNGIIVNEVELWKQKI